MGSITDVYSSVCKELKLRTNRYILEVLQETEGKTGDITLKLTGNDRLRKVERVTNKDALALSRTLRDNDSVTGLDLRYNCITDEGAGHLADLLKENVCLRSLDLTCNDIQTDGAEYIAKSLTSNDALLSLRLTGNKIGNGGAMHFASMLQVNSTLQELDVADSDLGTQSVIAFAIVLNNNKSLRSVNISRPLLFSHQEETAVHLSGMLVVNQCLRELHLGKMGMTDYGVERLTDALRTNYTLKYLDLRCNRVTRDGARCLAKVLKNNGTLEILDLASNRIEDDGAFYLSQAIALPTCNLKALSIPNNNIATVGLVSLSRAMQANNTLTHIYIWGNRLEEPVCQAFSDLLSSGRLSSEQTDVCVYEVDGCVCLAEVFHGLKRHYYWTPSYGQDSWWCETGGWSVSLLGCKRLGTGKLKSCSGTVLDGALRHSPPRCSTQSTWTGTSSNTSHLASPALPACGFSTYNRLGTVYQELGCLPQLRSLDLSHNPLDLSLVWKTGRDHLQNVLQFLGNELERPSNGLCQNLYNLELLGLSKNSLTTLPAEVISLGLLRELYVTQNQLENVPETQGALLCLQIQAWWQGLMVQRGFGMFRELEKDRRRVMEERNLQ